MADINENCIKREWDRISQKRLIIYGTGNTGKSFYSTYRNLLPIYACTSSEKNTVPIEQLKVVSYQELNPKTDFLIICSVAYEDIRYSLMLDGWEVNCNFMKLSIFEIFYNNASGDKKLIVAIGQCEIREIFEVLLRMEFFCQNYSVIYFDERKVCNHGNKRQLPETMECIDMLEKADYFVRPSVLSPIAIKSYNFLQNKMKSNCVKIIISLFNFDSYWPQDIFIDRQISKYYVTKPGVKLCAYVESDRVIDRLLEEGIPCNEIISRIINDDFFDRNVVLENHQNTLKRVKIADRLADITIEDFVGENYSKIKLYCDRGHFDKKLLREYAKRLLIYLDEKKCINELEKIEVDDIFSRVNELPIYPSAAKILNLEWIDDSTRYRMVLPFGVKLATFQEYMELLIEYRYRAMNLLKLC